MLLEFLRRGPLLFRERGDEVNHSFGGGRSSQNAVDRDGGARAGLRNPPGDRDLGRLGHAIMHHLGGDLNRALAGDEHDSAPVALFHAGQVRPAEAHAGHDVDLKQALPVGIGDLLEWLGFKDAQVVDEDVHTRDLANERFTTGGAAEIECDALHLCLGHLSANPGQRSIDSCLGPAVHNHPGALAS